METTTTETTSNGITFETPWHEAGALVIRQHGENDNHRHPELGEPIAADPDLNAVDEGFVSFATRYVQRRGHVAIGTIFVMAEAWGIEVEGEYALCAACDPNAVIWPKSTMAFLSNLIYLLQRDPDTLGAHKGDSEAHYSDALMPALKEVDVSLYNAEQPQAEPRWLPAVLCGKREGIGQRMNEAPGGLLGALLAGLMGEDGAPEVSVSFAVVGDDGEVKEVKSLSDLLGARDGQPERQA